LLQKYFDKTNLTARQLFGSTPLPMDFHFRALNSSYAESADDTTPYDADNYSEIVGKLMWLSNVSRPDITWAVNQCARYRNNPSIAHYKATQYICRYLNSTHDYGLLFQGSTTYTMRGYCDASHHSCTDTAKSCTGLAFLIGDTVVAYQSKMQTSIAFSTAESEYMAMSPCIKHAVWLNRVFTDITSMQETTPIHVGEIVPPFRHDTASKKPEDILNAQLIYSDSKSAIAMVNNNQSGKLTKHIAKVYHYAREQVANSVVRFEHVKGVDNVSDIFTKPLPAPDFQKHRMSLGLRSLKTLT
jgi:hypothetical protein